MSKLTEFAKKMETMRCEMEALAEKEAKSHIKAALVDFFAKYPEIDKLTWTQYTPHFNDGDACVFGVNSVAAYKSKDEDEDDGDCDYFDHYHYESLADQSKNANEKALYKELAKDLEEFDAIFAQMEDAMETAFGDHVKVTATRTEITVDEYQHD